MHLIDANIFLELNLGQQNSGKARKYLSKVGKGEISAIITLFHADTVALRMETNEMDRSSIKQFYNDLTRFKGLEVIETGLFNRIKSIENFGKTEIDDSMILQTYQDYDVDILVSYDDDFDSFEDIDRKTPSEVLET